MVFAIWIFAFFQTVDGRRWGSSNLLGQSIDALLDIVKR
jgi:hypothetical protein